MGKESNDIHNQLSGQTDLDDQEMMKVKKALPLGKFVLRYAERIVLMEKNYFFNEK